MVMNHADDLTTHLADLKEAAYASRFGVMLSHIESKIILV